MIHSTEATPLFIFITKNTLNAAKKKHYEKNHK